MISGPILPHPRVILEALLQGKSQAAYRPGKHADSSEDAPQQPLSMRAASFLESGLKVLETQLSLGDEELMIDFLACDAAGAPVAILAVDEEEEDELPLRLLDLDLWFRENRFLLRQGLSHLGLLWEGLSWNRDLRIFVVSPYGALRNTQRLEPLRGLDLSFYEFRSLRLRGEFYWFVQEAKSWRSNGGRNACSGAFLLSAPAGLEDPQLAEHAEQILTRLDKLSPELESSGDRFCRETQLAGQTCLRLEVHNDRLWATIPGVSAELPVESSRDVDRVLDAVLRALLGWAPEGKGAAAWPLHDADGRMPGAMRAPPLVAVVDQSCELGEEQRKKPRATPRSPIGSQAPLANEHPLRPQTNAVAGTNLTDDEMEAFLDL